MADDQNPPDPQTPVSPTGQSASSDSNRPDSTIPAISDQTVATDSANSADQAVTTTPPQSSSDQTVQINSDTSTAEPNLVNVSPQVPPNDSVPPVSDTSPDTSLSDQPSSPLPVAEVPEPKPPETAVLDSSISVPSSPNQVPDVHPEAPSDTSGNEPLQQAEKMAEIKPEPPESATKPPNPSTETPSPSPVVSFGDLLSSENQLPSSPSIPSIPSSSPVPSVPSPPPPFFTNSQPVSPLPSPQSPVSSQLDLPAEASAKADQSVQLDQKLKEELLLRRQKANQKRHEKKEEMLNKLVALVQSHGKITNRESQKILHLPQSTLTDYFKELVSSGRLKLFGRKRGIYYTI